jgi:hypothetical protein
VWLMVEFCTGLQAFNYQSWFRYDCGHVPQLREGKITNRTFGKELLEDKYKG